MTGPVPYGSPEQDEPTNTLRKMLSESITSNGFNASKAKNVSNKIIDRIIAVPGEKWVTYGAFGTAQYITSRYRTIRDLTDAIKSSTFGFSRRDLIRLYNRFKYGNAIVEINKFIEQKTKAEMESSVLSWGDLFELPIENSKSALETRARQFFTNIADSTKIGISDLFDKLKSLSPNQMFVGIFNLLTTITLAGFQYATDNACTIGPVPLGGYGVDSPTSIHNIEVAHSNKEVKFRAVGSIFLAHQHGGQDSVKISGKLQGTWRHVFLTVLWIMSLLSQRYLQAFDWSSDLVTNLGSSTSNIELFRQTAGPITRMKSINDVVVQGPSFEKHIVFPVVTEHEIIPNCYIETFSFEELVSGGKDIINYDMLLRTYSEPTEFLADSERTIYGLKTSTKSQQVLEYGLNAFWRGIKWVKETVNLDTEGWKVKDYFDVDYVDCASTFLMGLGGFV